MQGACWSSRPEESQCGLCGLLPPMGSGTGQSQCRAGQMQVVLEVEEAVGRRKQRESAILVLLAPGDTRMGICI